MTQSSLKAVNDYLSRGWHILPIVRGEKIPAVKEVATYRERQPTTQELQLWFTFQNSGVGVITGTPSGLVVVDIDKPELFDKYIKLYPTDLIAKTPRGGYHLYYQYTDSDITINSGLLEPGVDVRGTGGYVVAPPTTISDKSYSWYKSGTASPLPKPLADSLRALSPVNLDIRTAVDGHELWERILKTGFTPGQHNAQVKDVARYLYRMGLKEDSIVATLSALNAKDNTPLPIRELIATVKSGLRYELSRQKAETKPGQSKFTVKPLLDIITDYSDYDVNWLIKDWIPDSALLVLSGPPESYKTWILLEAAIAVALGKNSKPFLGQFEVVNDASPVLIIQQEDFMGQTMQRIRTILTSMAREINFPMYTGTDDNGQTVISLSGPHTAPIYVHPDNILAFDNEESITGLEEVIKEIRPKLIVIDPLYMLDKADDFFAGVARSMRIFKRMRETYGVTFIIAHHDRKSGGDGRSKIYGSQLLNGAFEGAILIGKSEGNRYIERGGKFFTGGRKFQIVFDIDTTLGAEKYDVTVTENSVGVTLTGKYDEKIIQILKEGGAMTQTEVAERVEIARSIARSSLNRLVDEGHIEKSGNRYFINDTDLVF